MVFAFCMCSSHVNILPSAGEPERMFCVRDATDSVGINQPVI